MKKPLFLDRICGITFFEILCTGQMVYKEAMLLQYNKRLKYPLRWKSLLSEPEQPSVVQTLPPIEEEQISIETTFSYAAPAYEDVDLEEYDEEEIPDLANALPQQMLLDNLGLRYTV